jgi:hypothetical protein
MLHQKKERGNDCLKIKSLLMPVLCASHRTAECIELARQGLVQSELPILVLSSEPAGVHLIVQEVTGRKRGELSSSDGDHRFGMK